MTHKSLVILVLLSLLGCGDDRPSPVLTTGRIPMDAGITNPSSPQVNPTHNNYSCFCRWRVPLECWSRGNWWCGLPTTGTSVESGTCDFGLQETRLYFPSQWLPTNPNRERVPTLADLEQDCQNRLAPIVGEILRMEFWECRSACSIQFGCSATYTDGSVPTSQETYCDTVCPRVPLRWVDGAVFNTNFLEATYVPPHSSRPVCTGHITGDSQLVCRLNTKD